MPPRVTVILTTYNRAALLMEAIASVQAQAYSAWELIVADDGSTDETPQQLARLLDSGTLAPDSLRYERLPHSGRPEVARNRALALAQGEFVAFLDDDDLWQPDKLSRQVARLDEDPSLGFVYSDVNLLRPDGSLSEAVLSPRQKQSPQLFDDLLTDCFIHPSTVLIRRRLLDELGRFDERFFSQGDYDLWLRAAHRAGAACVVEPLVYVRQSDAGLARQRDLLHYQNAILVVEQLNQTLPLTLRQRLRSRLGRARWQAHVGLLLLATGQRAEARRALLRALTLNPVQRRPWEALLATLRP